MKKKKTYQTSKPKDKKMSFTITVDTTKLPNKLHFETQLKTRANVFEDKRFKKPKYKNKFEEE